MREFGELDQQNGHYRATSLADKALASTPDRLILPAVLLPVTDMPADLLNKVEACYQQAERYFSRGFIRPQVNFALRGKAAGTAHLQRNLLRFNAQLYQENREHFLQQTVPHEVAHMVAHQVYGSGIEPHGPQWQSVMTVVFGLPAQRCHSYELPPVWKTLYAYACACREHGLSGQRHARVMRGNAYLCRHCNSELRFTGSVERKLVER